MSSAPSSSIPIEFEVMNSVYKELELRRPGERAIIFDPENGDILFADLLLDGKNLEDGANVQELINPSEEPSFYQIASLAIGRPGQILETDCLFRGAQKHLRARYLAEPERRVAIFVNGRRPASPE
jgi:hypothetical protein